MPEPLLRALDLSIARRVEGLLPGDHRSSLLGRGNDLAQIRPYEPVEDDVRQIDWNVTARTGTTHVRIHLAERALVTWLVLDTSPSMTFGTAERRKADVAKGLRSRSGTRRHAAGTASGSSASATNSRARCRRGRAGPDCSACCSPCARRRADGGRRRTGGATSVGEALQRVGQPGAATVIRRRRLRLPRPPRLAPAAAHARRPPPCRGASRSATRGSRSSRSSGICVSSIRRPAGS